MDFIRIGATVVRTSDIESIEPPQYQGSSPDRTIAIITMKSGREHRVPWNSGHTIEDLQKQWVSGESK